MIRAILFFTLLLASDVMFGQSDSGLVAHWTFNGNAYDSSGNGHNGIMNNVTPTTGRAGKPNTAMRFNGSDTSNITVGYQADLNLVNYSICATIKPEGFYSGICQHNSLLYRGDEATPGFYFLGFFDNAYDSTCSGFDTNLHVFFTGGGSNYPYHASWQSNVKVHTNQWYSVVGTFNGSVFRIYVNGVLTTIAPPQSPVPLGSSTQGLGIGGNTFANSAQFPYWYKGLMDDLRIYNRVLSDSEIITYTKFDVDTTDTSVAVQHVTEQFSRVSAAPNPNTGSFVLEGIVDTGIAAVEVYNMMGVRVYKTLVTPVGKQLHERIDLSHVADGTYIISVVAEGQRTMHKVTVQR